MNEVVKASLSGIGFVFDKEAFEVMDGYISELQKRYEGNPDGAEIISDIEARIVELILSVQSIDTVVSLERAQSIVAQMGVPEDAPQGTASARGQSGAGEASRKFPRRLYRNPDGAKLGGVWNGLATFFDTDPVYFRLGMFLPLLLLIIFPTIGFNYINGFLGSLFGALVLLYFLMWIAIPVARTPRQKLEMEGENVTASTIQERVVRESASMPEHTRESASIMARIFVVLGQLVVFGVKLIAIIVAFSLALAAIGLLVGLISIPFVSIGTLSSDTIGAFSNLEGISTRAYVSILIAVGLIPLIILVYQIFRLIFNRRNNPTLMWILTGAWILVVVYAGVITVRNIDNIKHNLEHQYSNLEFVRERIKQNAYEKKLGTIVINGDTLIHNGNIPQVDALLNKLQKSDTLGNFSYAIQEKSRFFSIRFDSPKADKNHITITLSDDDDN